MPQTVWIARHANRLDFVNPEWFKTAERPYDPPLSDDGFLQAQQLAKRLAGAGITHIFASPFLRTVQTAYVVAEALAKPIKLESGLSEWLNPEWFPAMPQRLSPEALKALYPQIDLSYSSRVLPRYPETEEECFKRTRATVRQLVTEFPEDILLVAHGASVLGSVMELGGFTTPPDLQVSLCCLFKFVRYSQEWVMELKGDTSHLSATETVIRFN